MTSDDMGYYRERLLALRARLRSDVDQLADAALKKSRSEANGDLSSMPIHMADIGSDNFEQEFTLSLMENDGAALEKIESSLERIEEGSYGKCEECGAKIPKSRLNAIPYATHCVKCASQQEVGGVNPHRPPVREQPQLRNGHEGGSPQSLAHFLRDRRRSAARPDLATKQLDVRLAGDARPRPRHLVGVERRLRLPDEPQRRGSVRPGPGRSAGLRRPFRGRRGGDLLLVVLRRRRQRPLPDRSRLGCVTAGILGNLYDRLGLPGLRWIANPPHHAGDPVHAVRDWILVMIGPWHWPNFNVADSLLVCGALLVWHSFTLKPKPPQPA